MATTTAPTPIRDATPDEARVIVDHEIAWIGYRQACRRGTQTQVETAEGRWKDARAVLEATFPMKLTWYRLGGRRWGWHDFDGSGLSWGSRPDKVPEHGG